MTIEVSIANKDASRPLEVATVEIDKATGRRDERATHRIAPGEQHTFHVYLLRDLIVRERDEVSKSVA